MPKETDATRRTLLVAISTGVLGGTAGCATLQSVSDRISSTGGSDSRPETEDHDGHGGGGAHSHGANPLEAPVERADVAMLTDDGHHFDPHLAWVDVGGTVTWACESGAHTATAYHPEMGKPLRIVEEASSWDSGICTEGETFTRTFERPGVYDYYCAPHETMGMVGSVIVGEPDAHDQPGLADPQDQLPQKARHLIGRLNEQADETLGHTHG